MEQAAVARVGKIDQEAIGADFHASTFPTVLGDLKFDAEGEWQHERNLYVQYQGMRGNDVEQFKKPGVEVILYPDQYKSGKLLTPFPAAGFGARRFWLCRRGSVRRGPPRDLDEPAVALGFVVGPGAPSVALKLPRRTPRQMTLDPVLLLNALASGLLLGAFYALAAFRLAVAARAARRRRSRQSSDHRSPRRLPFPRFPRRPRSIRR